MSFRLVIRSTYLSMLAGMNSFISFFRTTFFKILQLIWFGKHNISNKLSIYVKTQTGNTLSVDLDPRWDIREVKEIVAPQMGMSPEYIKIIFAGKELHNSTIIENCDLGQQSILHAVRVPVNKPKPEICSSETITEQSTESSDELLDTGSKPLNETLADLTLNDTENIETALPPSQSHQPAHFFVYCSFPCKSIQPGKLRVKCALCHCGAVTVDRDPQSWPDVIQPNRITIHCESDHCHFDGRPLTGKTMDTQVVPFAQFYFKCASHPSRGETDEAVPLYLIRPNSKRIPCLACADIRENVLVFPCNAAHVTCLDCFKDYCTVRLLERQFEFDISTGYYTLPCPAGCDDSYIQEIHHFRILTPTHYELYQRFGTEEYVLRAGGLLCPRPDCGMGIIPPDNDVTDENCRKITCVGGCGYVFCRNCLSGYHVGECYEQQSTFSNSHCHSTGYSINPTRAKDAKWDDATTNVILKSTKPCPKCRTPTERDGGCMHMVCTRAGCGFQWCWVCQTTWSRECMSNHWFG